MKNIALIALSASLALSSGCATITRGSTDTLVVESDPPGAQVRLSNGMSGKTPTSFVVPRKGGFTAKIEREGYEPVEVMVNSRVAGAGAAGMAGNVVVGGIIGVAVDAGTGAMYDVTPNPIRVNLVKKETDYVASSNGRWVRILD
jgi:hypothetical protein